MSWWEIFEVGLMRRAFLAAIMIGFMNGFVSAFVVLHRSPLKLGALSHSVFPGIAVAVMLVGFMRGHLYWSAFCHEFSWFGCCLFCASRCSRGGDGVGGADDRSICGWSDFTYKLRGNR